MFLLKICKRNIAGLIVFFMPLFICAQTQYDYYDDDSVAGGVDVAVSSLIIIVGLVLAFFVLAFIGNGLFSVYYWFNPEADPAYKKRKAKEVEEKKEYEKSVQKQRCISISQAKIKAELTLSEIEKIIVASTEEIAIQKQYKNQIGVYSSNYKKFIKYDSRFDSISLEILDGTETICSDAIHSFSLTNITFPQSLMYIGDRAVKCESLKEIILPDSLRYIGNYAFWSCKQIRELIIPHNVSYIGELAIPYANLELINNQSPHFKIVDDCLYTTDMRRLIKCFGNNVEIVIPEGVINITGAFAGCSKLEHVLLPNSLSTIGECSFLDCKCLKEIDFNNTILEIGYRAFENCLSLTHIRLPEKIKNIGDLCFNNCENLRYVQIPDSLEIEVSDNPKEKMRLFDSCTSLEHVFIPNGSKEYFSSFIKEELLIESTPRDYYNNRLRINREEETRTELRTNVTEKDKLEGFTDEYGVRYSADGNRLLYSTKQDGIYVSPSTLTEYKVKEGTKVICDEAFSSGRINSIILPDSLEIIGNGAFSDCWHLLNINIPDSVTSIGAYAFQCCSVLYSIHLPQYLSILNDRVFYGCSALREIALPPSIKLIGDSSFYQCDSLREICIPDSVEYIGDNAFGACDRLKKIIVPHSAVGLNGNPFTATILCGEHYHVESNSPSFIIENSGLYTCDRQTLISCLSNENHFDVIDGTICIGKSAFSYSSKLVSINLTSSIVKIEDYAFSNCKRLSNICIHEGIEYIGKRAFCGCENIVEIILPSTLNSIEEETFHGCDNLVKITIKNPNIIINKNAFSSIEHLEYIEFYGCPKDLDSELFADNDNLKYIIVQKELKRKIMEAFPSMKKKIITRYP